jgi:hypothetical protein
METVWAVMSPKLKGVSGSFKNMKLAMFTDPLKPHKAFPKLKGRAFEIKTVLEAVLVACQRFMNPAGNVTHAMIVGALQFSIEMENILSAYADDFCWPNDVSDAYIHATFSFLVLFTSLNKHFKDLKEGHGFPSKLFNTTIKCHMLAHSALMAKHMNPRISWCYSGEDMMKHMRSLTHSVVFGNKLQDICWTLLRKYRCGMNLKARQAPLKKK